MTLITPLYAGLLALIFIWLSANVTRARYSERVTIGDGGSPLVIKRMRVHANFVEYAPIALLLMLMAELQGMPGWVTHLLGIGLVAGRGLHAYGLGSTPQVILARRWGMFLTAGVIGVLAVANIAHALV